VFIGCNKPSGSVSGKVTYNGKALKGGNVTFVGGAGQPSGSASIKEDGTYFIPKLAAGPYKVVVETESLRPPRAIRPKMGGGPPKGKGGLPEGVEAPPGYSASSPADAVAAKNAKLYTHIPEKYSAADTTDLSYEIKGGEQKYDIDLK
jgi:hypothetical protein